MLSTRQRGLLPSLWYKIPSCQKDTSDARIYMTQYTTPGQTATVHIPSSISVEFYGRLNNAPRSLIVIFSSPGTQHHRSLQYSPPRVYVWHAYTA